MFRPNGKQIEKLRNALLAAFPSESRLTELATFDLEKNLNEIEGNDLSARSLNLILWAIPQGRLRRLIEGASARVPGNDELSSIANELLPLLEAPVPATPSERQSTQSLEALPSSSVSRGLLALSELMKDPAARNLIGELRLRLADTHTQISIIGDYKDVHDSLHRLRVECYEPAITALESSEAIESVRENFSFCRQTLRNIVTNIGQVTSRNAIVKRQTAGLTELDSLLDEITVESDQTFNREPIKWRLRSLNQLITENSFRVNTLLKSTTAALKLDRLLELMTAVQLGLQPLSLEPERFQSFTVGLKDLKKVARSLGHLVDSHDDWQFVDNILSRIEELLETHGQQFFSDIELQWPTLKRRTSQIYKRTGGWARDFAETADLLESAIDSQDMVKTQRCFRYYRRAVFSQFYMVDFTLKQQCYELQKLGDPIREVLQWIQ